SKIEDRGWRIDDLPSSILHPPSSTPHPPTPNTQHPTPNTQHPTPIPHYPIARRRSSDELAGGSYHHPARGRRHPDRLAHPAADLHLDVHPAGPSARRD